MMLQQGRKLSIPVIFARKATDTHNRETVVYLESELTIKVWDEEGYEEFELRLIKGHSGRLVRVNKDSPQYFEPMLKVFLWVPNEAGGSVQEIDGFLNLRYDGLTVKCGTKEEKVISAKEAAEKINSGTCLFLNEDYSKRTIDC